MELFGRAILWLEALWALQWVVWMFLFHFLAGSTGELRVAFFFLAFHAANAAAVYSTLARVNKGKRAEGLAILSSFFALFTDMNSLLEGVLHLSAEGVFYGLFLALVIFAMILSVAALAWILFLWCAPREELLAKRSIRYKPADF